MRLAISARSHSGTLQRGHWICTSYLNGVVRVYDSLFNGKLSPSVKEMLIRLYRPAVASGHLLSPLHPLNSNKEKLIVACLLLDVHTTLLLD